MLHDDHAYMDGYTQALGMCHTENKHPPMLFYVQ